MTAERDTSYHLFTKSGTVHYGGPSRRDGYYVLACTGRAMWRVHVSIVDGPVSCGACLRRFGANAS